MRQAILDPENDEFSSRWQCELLGVDRDRPQRGEVDMDEEGRTPVCRLDELHLRFPEFGAPCMSQWLLRESLPGVFAAAPIKSRLQSPSGLHPRGLDCKPQTNPG